MEKKFIFSVALASSLFAIDGCSNNQPKPVTKPVKTDPAIETIKQAVLEIKKEQHMLAAIERENKPEPREIVIPALPEFKTPLYLANWTGPVDEVLKTIAEIIGYQYRQSGNFGIMPIVHVNSQGDPVSKVLIRISDQGEGKFDIRLDSAQRTLTLVSK